MPLTLVTGPANAEKAGHVLAAYRAALAREPLLVVPTAADVEHYRRELAESGAVFGVRVLRFAWLEREIARRAGVTGRPLGTLARERVARAAVAGAGLERLAASAATPGFLPAFLRLVDELEEQRVAPGRWYAALRAWAAHAPGQAEYAEELAALYGAYRDALGRLGRRDAVLHASAALDALRLDPARWGGTPVVLYGFDDLTPLELDAVETLAVHAGAEPDPETGAVVPAIQMSTTFKQDGVGGLRGGFEYGRSGNPTRAALEDAIASLEGGTHGLAFASGLAATQTIGYLLDPRDRLLMSDDVYGGTWRLADQVWRRYGIETDPIDLRDLDAVAAAFAGDRPPRMVWIETPSNPLMKVIDISAVARLAAVAGAITVVDNTFATPYLQRPLEVGADLVLHSATKYLGGHSDVVSGLVATRSDELAERLRFHQNAAGAVPSPFDCFLVLRGLRTLAVRMERASANALVLALWLSERPEVETLNYPGMPDHPAADLVERQMRLPGAMLSFVMRDGEERARRFVGATRLFTLAESLGAVESLIELPAPMTHASVAESPLAVPPALVRLSVGIENADDLRADLESAFSASAS
jgi:cystathionine gamma-synthase